MAILGVEEEVFITEPERPTLRSLYYLARLLARKPRYYYTHSAHNFSRGSDLREGMMSGVEISTNAHENVDDLVDDLAGRRADLASVASGLIAPVGHLLDCETPTNTCAVHVHVGGVKDKGRTYNNILHFLPVLPLFTMNSPMVSGRRFGQSYRLSRSFAIGPIAEDWEKRFQDVIHSKRLGTIELRACDPCWDLERVRWLLRAVKAIADLDEALEPKIEMYNRLRPEICVHGLLDETLPVAEELRSMIGFPLEMLSRTASDELAEVYDCAGLVAAYSALDNGYRNGRFEPREVSMRRSNGIAEGIVGFVGYFLPRFPYYAWKGLKE